MQVVHKSIYTFILIIKIEGYCKGDVMHFLPMGEQPKKRIFCCETVFIPFVDFITTINTLPTYVYLLCKIKGNYLLC